MTTLLAFENNNMNEIFEQYKIDANQGGIYSQYYLADMYSDSKDYFNALVWYIKALENGILEAKNDIRILIRESGETTLILKRLFEQNSKLEIENERLKEENIHLSYAPNGTFDAYTSFVSHCNVKKRKVSF